MNQPVLLLGDVSSDTLSFATLCTLQALLPLHSNDITLWLIGEVGACSLEQAQSLPGLAAIWTTHSPPEHIESLSEHIANHQAHYHHIYGAANSFGKSLLPRLAALLDCELQTAITALNSDGTCTRTCYTGQMVTTLKACDPNRRHMISICPSTHPPTFTTNTMHAYPCIDQPLQSCNGSSFAQPIHANKAMGDGPTLQQADVVIGGGRGLGCAANFTTLQTFADNIGAALGGSRAAVDAGWIGNHLQIGQTGQNISPKLYIAMGISGATQHIAGILGSQTIVAINKDANAPIFEVADFAMVMDWQEALEALSAYLLKD